MKERPILFSGEMVRTILDGRKTQTRRVAKFKDCERTGYPVTTCQYGKVGDRLWVREAFAMHWTFDKQPPTDIEEGATVWYAADGKASTDLYFDVAKSRLRPSIHMPRWASRINLEITGVRVERLNEISEDDAKAEGVQLIQGEPMHADEPIERYSAVAQFKNLWDKINGKKHPWASNPYVWVVEFKRVEK